jgi:hypothetical protein
MDFYGPETKNKMQKKRSYSGKSQKRLGKQEKIDDAVGCITAQNGKMSNRHETRHMPIAQMPDVSDYYSGH